MESFCYLRPKSLEETLILLQKYGNQAKIIAGGTDLIIKMKKEYLSPNYLIDITLIPELQGIVFNEDEGLTIGATTCLTEIESTHIIRSKFPIIAKAARVIGSIQIRNLGTVGGNICNASPAADLVPPLIAMGGKVKILSSEGAYWKDLENLFAGPGETVLQPSEILTHIRIPTPRLSMSSIYLKEGRTKGMNLAIVGVAVVIFVKEDNFCKDVSIVLGSVAPTPIRVKGAEDILKGKKITSDLIKKASQTSAEACQPISDIRGSAGYRKKLVEVLVQRALEGILIPKKQRN
jgi:carbon-monoxide dehydrogenase medium subunit